jgi:hypothetical protein
VKYKLLIPIAIAFFIAITTPFTSAFVEQGLISYWKFDDAPGTTALDSVSNNTIILATNNSVIGKIGRAFNNTGVNGGQSIYNISITGNQSRSIQAWTYLNNWPGSGMIAGYGKFSLYNLSFLAARVSGFNQFGFWNYANDLWIGNSTNLYYTGQWYHLIVTFNGTTYSLYVNGVLIESKVYSSLNTPASPFRLCYSDSVSITDAALDEVALWDRQLTSSEVTTLYNSGAGYNMSAPKKVTLTAKDFYTNTTITNFSISIINNQDAANYSTTNGTIYFTTENTTTNITIYDAKNNYGNYFNQTQVSMTLTTNISLYPYQAEIKFNNSEKISNSNTTSGTYYLDGKLMSTTNYTTAGTYALGFNSTNHYNETQTVSIPALFNGTLTIYNLTSEIINIMVRDANNSNNLTNITGYITNNNGWTETFSSGNSNLSTIKAIPGNYTIFASVPNYSISFSNYQNTSISTPLTTTQINFSLYPANTLYIYILDETTGLKITGINMTIILTNNVSDNYYYTTTGEKYITGLSDSDYIIKIQGGNYSLKAYTITVANSSLSFLYAYLSLNYQYFLLNIQDIYSSNSLVGATVSMYRMVNASWSLIDTRTSDITGRVQLSYIPLAQYKFIVIYPEYDTKLFYLDPVIFTTYDVKMQPSTVYSGASDYQGISIFFNPKEFYTNKTNNFTWDIISANGILTGYNLTIAWPGNYSTRSGNNANGEEFNINFNITSASANNPYLNLTYCYDTTISTTKCFSEQYFITITYSNTSMLSNNDNTYGLGLIERVSIGVFITIIVAGFISMVAGIASGAVIGLLALGYFSYIGFIPLWLILPSILVTLFLLFRRGGE